MHVEVSVGKVPAILPDCSKEKLPSDVGEFHEVHIKVQVEYSEIHRVVPFVAVLVGAGDIPLEIITIFSIEGDTHLFEPCAFATPIAEHIFLSPE